MAVQVRASTLARRPAHRPPSRARVRGLHGHRPAARHPHSARRLPPGDAHDRHRAIIAAAAPPHARGGHGRNRRCSRPPGVLMLPMRRPAKCTRRHPSRSAWPGRRTPHFANAAAQAARRHRFHTGPATVAARRHPPTTAPRPRQRQAGPGRGPVPGHQSARSTTTASAGISQRFQSADRPRVLVMSATVRKPCAW